MLIHLNVSKPHHIEPSGLQKLGARFIVGLMFVVDSSVQFDYQSRFQAHKVCYERTYRVLTPEFKSSKLSVP